MHLTLSFLLPALLSSLAFASPLNRLARRDDFTYRIILTNCVNANSTDPLPTNSTSNSTTSLALLYKTPDDTEPLGVSTFNSTPPFRPNIPNAIEWRVPEGPDTDGRYDLEYSPTVLGANVANLYDEEFPGEGVDGILIGGVNGAVWRLRVDCQPEAGANETAVEREVELDGVPYTCTGGVVCSGIF